jgi:hypothetical protein
MPHKKEAKEWNVLTKEKLDDTGTQRNKHQKIFHQLAITSGMSKSSAYRRK